MPEIDLGSVVGPQGEQGVPGPAGAEGKQGPQGATGEAGKSAYQAARDGGYTGSEADFNAIMAIIEKHAGRHKTGGADPLTAADVEAIENKGVLGTYTTVLEAASLGSSRGYSFSAVGQVNLRAAEDSPWGGDEVLYLVLFDTSRGDRRTVLAFNYTSNAFAVRCIFQSNWKTQWIYLTSTDYAVNKAGDTMTGRLTAPDFRYEREIGNILNAIHLGLSVIDLVKNSHSAGLSYSTETTDASGNRVVTQDSDLRFNRKGCVLFDKVDNLKHEILHTGNKPSGSYVGTGSDVEQAHHIGGIGSVLLIKNGSCLGFVYSQGAFLFTATGVTRIPKEQANFASGTLTLATTNEYLNSGTVQYILL